jgi:hypothetical protein
MVSVNSNVVTYSSPSSVDTEMLVAPNLIPCALFFTGLAGTDAVKLQMFVGDDTDDAGTESLWVTLKSNGAEVEFDANDNQFVIESAGYYRLKSTTTLTSTTTAVSGILHTR